MQRSIGRPNRPSPQCRSGRLRLEQRRQTRPYRMGLEPRPQGAQQPVRRQTAPQAPMANDIDALRRTHGVIEGLDTQIASIDQTASIHIYGNDVHGRRDHGAERILPHHLVGSRAAPNPDGASTRHLIAKRFPCTNEIVGQLDAHGPQGGASADSGPIRKSAERKVLMPYGHSPDRRPARPARMQTCGDARIEADFQRCSHTSSPAAQPMSAPAIESKHGPHGTHRNRYTSHRADASPTPA